MKRVCRELREVLSSWLIRDGKLEYVHIKVTYGNIGLGYSGKRKLSRLSPIFSYDNKFKLKNLNNNIF